MSVHCRVTLAGLEIRLLAAKLLRITHALPLVGTHEALASVLCEPPVLGEGVEEEEEERLYW